MSPQSPFDSSSQNDAAERIKLLIDKKRFVLSNTLSNNTQPNNLERSGNIYNGKLYDEKDVRTVKVMPNKRLHCKLEDSSKEQNTNDSSSFSSPLTDGVMTCGDNVVSNVKSALIAINVVDTDDKGKVSEQHVVNAQDASAETKDQLYKTYKNSEENMVCRHNLHLILLAKTMLLKELSY
jgi:hypothetical protein